VWLYVMRHGIASERGEWQGEEAARPLTEDGKARTKAVLVALSSRKSKELKLDDIWSSPLARALQTAEIAGKVLAAPVSVVGALACGASLPDLQAVFLKKRPVPERLMLVGHEPDCGALIGALVGDPEGDYALKKAGLAALKGEFEAGGMVLKWKLAPKDVLGQ
jgi:phosphohistidine phosphatase